MQKTLIIIGVLLILGGLLWPWLVKFPFGRFPGDIIINEPGLKVFIPITTMVLISVIASAILWWLRK